MLQEGIEVTTSRAKVTTPNFRVLIDARKLGHGGIGTYINNLMTGLVDAGLKNVSALVRPEQLSTNTWGQHVELIPCSIPLYSFQEHFGLAKTVDWSRFDLFHSPHFTLPRGIPIPSVVTIHDLIHISHPERVYYPIISGTLIRSAARRAKTLIVVSDATKQELSRFLKNDANLIRKIKIIPNALTGSFGSVKAPSQQMPWKYILCVSSLYKPHKGLDDLLAAWAQVPHSLKGETRLVVVGEGATQFIKSSRVSAFEKRQVHLIGQVSPEQLTNYYAGALGLVVPSRAEGFCLPALEALSFGVPVLARPIPALQELLGTKGSICEDMSVNALSRGLCRIITTPNGKLHHEVMHQVKETYSNAPITQAMLNAYKETLQ